MKLQKIAIVSNHTMKFMARPLCKLLKEIDGLSVSVHDDGHVLSHLPTLADADGVVLFFDLYGLSKNSILDPSRNSQLLDEAGSQIKALV